jgi:hypothetical protein
MWLILCRQYSTNEVLLQDQQRRADNYSLVSTEKYPTSETNSQIGVLVTFACSNFHNFSSKALV